MDEQIDKVFYWGEYLRRQVSSTISELGDVDIVDKVKNVFESSIRSKEPEIDLDSQVSTSAWDKASQFAAEHKYLCTILGLSAVAGGVLFYQNKYKYGDSVEIVNGTRTRKKRRAYRLENGARNNVVIIVGSPMEPLVRIVANDLNKRGFIVYITAVNEKDINFIESENSDDIRSLKINCNNEEMLQRQLVSFGAELNGPVVPFKGAKVHHLKLVGVLIIPDLSYPVGPLENTDLKELFDTVNAKIFFPLILFSNKFMDIIRNNSCITFENNYLNTMHTKLILMTPNLNSSINMPFHIPESLCINALNTVFESFAREILSDDSLKLDVITLKIGALNLMRDGRLRKLGNSGQMLGWSSEIRSHYGQSFKHICDISGPSSSFKGTNLRELSYKIFDLLYSDVNKFKRVKRDIAVSYVGLGARTYDWVGKYLPKWVVSWTLGCTSTLNVILRLVF